MSQFTAGMQAELVKPSVLMFAAVEIDLPGKTLRLIDGAGQLTFGGNTFVGKDADFGAIAAASTLSDGADDTAPSLNLTLYATTLTAAADVSSPAAQGSPVSIWIGAVNPATGVVIADPLLMFVGEHDYATWNIDKNSRTLDLAVISAFDRFFEQDEGARLNDGFHESIWPAETGLEFISQVDRQIPWGNDNPRPSLITVVPPTGGSNGFPGGFPGLGGGGGSGFFGPSLI